MSEVEFWRKIVRPKLIPFGVLHRIENVVELGTPDVTYTLRRDTSSPAFSGWIELKHVVHWPARAGTLVRFKRFTVDQAAWLDEWGRIGGKACLLIQIENDYALLSHRHAFALQRGVPGGWIRQNAEVLGEGVFPTGRVVKWLTEKT